jgi:hypothetical protein
LLVFFEVIFLDANLFIYLISYWFTVFPLTL